MTFKNRSEAGKLLAEKLISYEYRPNLIILALPRGGVPVAYEIAKRLHVPLDIFIVRKLGFPGHEEFAMGAIASGGITVLNHDVLNTYQLDKADIEKIAKIELTELHRREKAYRGRHPAQEIAGKTVIVVDDGLATGASMRAAVKALRRQSPEKIVVAVPVAPSNIKETLAEADEIIYLFTPVPFYAVGFHYEDFSQTEDDEVRDLLRRSEDFFKAESA